MNYRRWMVMLGIAIVASGGLASAGLHAETLTSDGYSVEDFRLDTASELVDVCTLEPGHPDHALAIAFCYGFFEGATHYHDALSPVDSGEGIVCNPPDVTRTQAVAVFTDYVGANPRYGSEPPIDAVFRALVAKWPCTE